MPTLRSSVPSSLQDATEAMAAVLHWPDNLGIEFRPIRLQTQPETALLAVFVHGLAQEDSVRRLVLEPLEHAVLRQPAMGPIRPEALPGILAAPRLRTVRALPDAVCGVLEGATALFIDRAAEAVLIDTCAPVTHPAGAAVPENPYKDVFGADLADNVAMVRKRLRDPMLVAEPHTLPGGRAARAAVVYAEGRAAPELIGQLRAWLQACAGEEALRRGLGGKPALLGLLPQFLSCPWPDMAAALLDVGHVVALVERVPYAYIAPVTAPALAYGPGDENFGRPVAGVMRVVRLLPALLILAGPATVVALMNYHQEMIPTPFLLGLASVRENAPLPVIAEVVLLEVMQEVLRATTLRLPVPVSPGQTLVASMILAGLLVFGGMVAPLPALISLTVLAATFGLPSRDLALMVRTWRWPMIAGATIFGLFGMASVGFLFATYLTQAESFGVPFLGETGLKATSPGRVASRQEGGSIRAADHSVR